MQRATGELPTNVLGQGRNDCRHVAPVGACGVLHAWGDHWDAIRDSLALWSTSRVWAGGMIPSRREITGDVRENSRQRRHSLFLMSSPDRRTVKSSRTSTHV